MKKKTIIQMIAFFVAVLFFVPVFSVSCYGESTKLSANKVMTVITLYGETITDPAPVLAVLLLLPIVIIGIWFVKIGKNKIAIATIVLAVVELLIWIVLWLKVNQYVTDMCFTAKTLFAYKLVLILNVLIVGLAAWIIKETDEKKVVHPTVEKSHTDLSPKPGAGFCGMSGSPMIAGASFCGKCGNRLNGNS